MTSSFATIHMGKKALGLDDDTYRAKLMKITGKASTKDMSEDERQKVILVFRNEGFEAKSAARRPGGRAKLSGRFAKKLQALWIGCWNLGIVDNRDDAALTAFVKRQTGLDAVRFVNHAEDASAAIEALKGWMTREAGVNFTSAVQSWQEADGARIAWAQWKRLNPGVDIINRRGFDAAVMRILGRPGVQLHCLTAKDWQSVMNDLGKRVRAAKAGA